MRLEDMSKQDQEYWLEQGMRSQTFRELMVRVYAKGIEAYNPLYISKQGLKEISQREPPERLEFPNGVKITFVHYDLPNWEYPDKETKNVMCFITYRNSGKRGVARCHPNDVYNRYFGEKLALRKALKDVAVCMNNIFKHNEDADKLEKMIEDKKFYQEIWRAFFKANGLNERGE